MCPFSIDGVRSVLNALVVSILSVLTFSLAVAITFVMKRWCERARGARKARSAIEDEVEANEAVYYSHKLLVS